MTEERKENRGGYRPGSGGKTKPPTLLQIAGTYEDPEGFLRAVMNDSETDVKVRVEAAKAILAAKHKKQAAKGKKEERQEAAQAVAGRFTAVAPPKLAAVGGK